MLGVQDADAVAKAPPRGGLLVSSVGARVVYKVGPLCVAPPTLSLTQTRTRVMPESDARETPYLVVF